MWFPLVLDPLTFLVGPEVSMFRVRTTAAVGVVVLGCWSGGARGAEEGDFIGRLSPAERRLYSEAFRRLGLGEPTDDAVAVSLPELRVTGPKGQPLKPLSRWDPHICSGC